jgi:hypothetical protein
VDRLRAVDRLLAADHNPQHLAINGNRLTSST